MLLCAVVFALLFGFMIHLYTSLIMKPSKIRKIFGEQGIHGPPSKFLLGSNLEISEPSTAAEAGPPAVNGICHVYPFLEPLRKKYGELFTFSMGTIQTLHVSDPNVAKELATTTSKHTVLASFHQVIMDPLLGKGILVSNGATWARQRKFIAAALSDDGVQRMMGIMTESARTVVDTWKQEIEASGGGAVDIDVLGYMKRFASEIISGACFGSNYAERQDIFLMLDDLMDLITKRGIMYLCLPALRHIPTTSNRKIWALEKKVRASILRQMKERHMAGYEKDMLQSLMEGAKETYSTSSERNEFVVDNYKNIYVAGSEGPAVTASWCLMLLALNPEWQTRVRDEVEQVCRGQAPNDMNMLRKMNQLHMVLQETMRLYPVIPTLDRQLLKEATIGGVRIPEGVNVWTVVARLHTDPKIWGPDALEFKPERFRNGISGACNSPNCYMPFGFGQRVCVGKHMAMVELKLLMSLIVSNFSITLSPKYVHEPVIKVVVTPKHGVRILINKI